MCFLVIGKYKERGVFCSSGHNAEAERFVKQARASGSISSVEGAADEYTAWKQARADWIEQEEAADAAFVQEMLTSQQPPASTFDPAKWKQQDYAESTRWEQQQAYQRYRQGEWAEPQPQKKSWWQKAGDWLQQKVVQPVRQAAGTIVNALKPPQTAGSSKLAAPAKDGLPWWERWIEKGKEIVRSVTEKAVEAKRWFTGENVGYTGSGWGHGPRQWIAKQVGLDDSVGNIFTLVSRSLLQYDKVNLDGSLLEKLQSDPAMQGLEQSIMNRAMENPKYGKDAFSFEIPADTYEFGGKRAPGDMWEQLKHPFSGLRGNTIEYVRTHGLIQTVKDLFDPNTDVIRLNYADTWKVGFNELTWALRHATVQAQVHVSKQGEIHIEYQLWDELDLEPSPGRSSAYNAITEMLGRLYHDILGGNNQMRVQANWSSNR